MTTFPENPAVSNWHERRQTRVIAPSLFPASWRTLAHASLLEIGPADGARAAILLTENPNVKYHGFEPSRSHLPIAQANLACFGSRASIAATELAFPLPLPSDSQDGALCLDLLEYLRMDELYMVLAELRRVLRTNSFVLLRTLSGGGNGARARAALAAWRFVHHHQPGLVRGARPLNLHHYISPEDWRVVHEEIGPAGWLSCQAITIQKL